METFVGDTIELDVATGIDLSGYDDLIIKFRRPNDTEGFWDATLDPGDNTHMLYTTLPTDLNMVGTWAVQAHAHDVSAHLHGKWVNFEVFGPGGETSTPPTTLGPTTLA